MKLEANSIFYIDIKYFCIILTHAEITSNRIVWVNCLEIDIMSWSKKTTVLMATMFKESELSTQHVCHEFATEAVTFIVILYTGTSI